MPRKAITVSDEVKYERPSLLMEFYINYW